MTDAERPGSAIESEAVEAAEVRRFPCRQCGAQLNFAPGTDQLNCTHCGAPNEIEAVDGVVHEQDFDAAVARLAAAAPTDDVETVKCDGCGAEMDPPAVHAEAFPCAYCGADLVTAPTCSARIRPAALLPFAITRQQAHAAFARWIKGLWFAPGDLKRRRRTDDRLQGVYVPYWTYDCRADTTYTGRRGEHYWVTERYTTRVNGKTVTRTRRKRKTRWYPASGRVRDRFDDVLVIASHSLPREIARKLEPWDLAALQPYQEEYLAGFRSERYQVDLESGFGRATQLMEPVIVASIRRDIGGDEQRILSMSSQYDDITYKHLLLPVWISAYRYKDRVYRILVNARTGEVQGERPWSFWKILFAVLAGMAAAALVALVVAAGR